MGDVIQEVDGSSGRTYQIIRGGDGVVYCTCMAWKMNKRCKHLDAFFNSVGVQQKAPKQEEVVCVASENTGSSPRADQVFEALEQSSLWEV